MSDELQRALPSWMKQKETAKLKQSLKKKGKLKTARAVFYCMNEKELLEAALFILSDGPCVEDIIPLTPQKVFRQAEEKVEASASQRLMKTKCSKDQEVTSASDLDICEVQTLPYATDPVMSGSDSHKRPCSPAHSEKRNQSSLMITAREEKEDDDYDNALQLVRDIFFS